MRWHCPSCSYDVTTAKRVDVPRCGVCRKPLQRVVETVERGEDQPMTVYSGGNIDPMRWALARKRGIA